MTSALPGLWSTRLARLRASARGVLVDGARCGARAPVTQTGSRVASGRRPSLLRGAAFNGWEGHGTRTAKAVRDTGGLIPFGPSPVSTVPRSRDATVERREASVLRKARGAFAKVPTVTKRLSALRPLMGADDPELGSGRETSEAEHPRAFAARSREPVC